MDGQSAKPHPLITAGWVVESSFKSFVLYLHNLFSRISNVIYGVPFNVVVVVVFLKWHIPTIFNYQMGISFVYVVVCWKCSVLKKITLTKFADHH